MIFNEEIDQGLDEEIIGSLILAINGFAGEMIDGIFRSLVFANVRLAFSQISSYILVIITDRTFDVENNSHFLSRILNVANSIYHHQAGLMQHEEVTQVIKAVYQAMFILGLNDFQKEKSKIPSYNALKAIKELTDEVLQKIISLELLNFAIGQDYFESQQAQRQLLRTLHNDLTSVTALALIKVNSYGTMDTIFEGDLEIETYDEIFQIILDKSIELNQLLESTQNELALDLEDRWIVFYRLSPKSMLYLIGPTRTQIKNNFPLVEKFMGAFLSIFPEFL